jgi:hypothetical protein
MSLQINKCLAFFSAFLIAQEVFMCLPKQWMDMSYSSEGRFLAAAHVDAICGPSSFLSKEQVYRGKSYIPKMAMTDSFSILFNLITCVRFPWLNNVSTATTMDGRFYGYGIGSLRTSTDIGTVCVGIHSSEDVV